MGRLMEPDMDIVPCFNDASFCVIEPACLLKGALAEASSAPELPYRGEVLRL
jgi:hypothetical protein